PVQTANGQLTIKAYRLSKAFMRVYREKKNEVIKPSEILEELPIKIRNPGIINALIFDLQVCGWGLVMEEGRRDVEEDRVDCDFDRLDLSTNPYLEKNLEFLCNWIDDLSNEQQKFNQYTRNVARQKQQDQARLLQKRKQQNDERRAAGEEALPEEDSAFDKKLDAPNRMEGLLISNQISAYCSQINKFAGSSFEKLFLAGSLQKEA
ncbi:unnamed protein product, partial [Ectocarpus sp. 12 AP-2014]